MSSKAAAAPGRWRGLTVCAVLDVAAVVTFVLGGRGSHDEGSTITGTARTAWPFLAGLVAAWLVTRAWRNPLRPLQTGLPVALVTVLVGMAARVVSGQGTAMSFIIVATIVLTTLMVGWRALAGLLLRRGASAAT